jgi:4-amino-4-deoxychorismate lyase
METKPLLIETVRIQNGRVRNIKYHNQRCNYSRKVLFSSMDFIDLRKSIDPSSVKCPEVKCRISYDDVIRKVEYEPYVIRQIHSLQHIEIEDFAYSFKYKNREKLKEFFDQRGKNDDVLMLKRGYITDTYYANVALRKKGKWFTPMEPLLKGSNRERLLEKEIISASKIHIDQLHEFDAISIFNAMIPFKKIVIDL